MDIITQSGFTLTIQIKMAEMTNNPDFINLKVKSQEGQQIFFKIKRTTMLKKMMQAYCQRQNLQYSSVRFIFDGDRIQDSKTPKELGMENGDEIDAVVQQLGGSN